jgi:hypothetical protein
MIDWTRAEITVFKKLNTPAKIQDYLNALPFNFEEGAATLASPRRVLATRRAHCLEGALFAGAVLSYHGYKPLLLDLRSSKKDFDHVVALFQKNGKWGAISKTNHTVLRYREPVYKNIRELAMSYFHEYFLHDGTKTLESFSTKPFDLSKYGKAWITTNEDLWEIGADIDDAPHTNILDKKERKNLRKADKIEIEAGKITEWRKAKKVL